MAARGLRLSRRRPLEKGVGRIVERDGGLEVEHARRPLEQMRLDGRAVGHQGIRRPVQAHRAQALEVHPEQLARGRALAQPAPGRAFRARRRHAADDRGHRRGALRRVEPQAFQQPLETELLHRPKPDMLDARRTRTHRLRAVHVDRLNVRTTDGIGRRAAQQLRGNPLRLPFHVFGTGELDQRDLAVEQLPDPGAQRRPVPAFDGKLAAEVQQRALADPLAAAFRADQAIREIGLAALGGAAPGAPDEHAGRMAAIGGDVNPLGSFYVTTSRPAPTRAKQINGLHPTTPHLHGNPRLGC